MSLKFCITIEDTQKCQRDRDIVSLERSGYAWNFTDSTLFMLSLMSELTFQHHQRQT